VTAQLDRAGWEEVQALLLARSGGYCEARTPHCYAPRGVLLGLSRDQVSIHHRQPRGAGGTSNTATHSLANLMLICGTGVTGCHGWIESNRACAEQLGLLVVHSGGQWTPGTDPATVAVAVGGWRRVFLHPTSPIYIPPADGNPYAA
jgi:hypothetical protein